MTRRDFIGAGMGFVASAAMGRPIRSSIGGRMEYGEESSKPYDNVVEYLESTGTQYIDTGVTVPDPKTISLEIDEDVAQPFGFTHQNSVNGTWIARYAPPTVTNTIYLYRQIYTNRFLLPATETRKITRFDGATGYYEDGVKKADFVAKVGTDSIGNRSWLYGAVYDFMSKSVDLRNARSGKVYGIKVCIYDTLVVRDMVPVRFTNELGESEGALYDIVYGELFRNRGAGSYIIGPDV